MNLKQRRLLTRLTLALFFVAVLSQAALAERHERLIDGWRPVHFDVSLAFNDSLSELASVKTDVTVTAVKKDVVMIDLDFGKMPVKSVLVDGSVARFAQHDEKLDVYLSGPAR